MLVYLLIFPQYCGQASCQVQSSITALTPSAGRDLVSHLQKVQYSLKEEIDTSIFTLKSMMIKNQQELVPLLSYLNSNHTPYINYDLYHLEIALTTT